MQKDANLVDLEKCCQTHIFLQNFVLIQPRTSPPKICKNLLIFPILLTLTAKATVTQAAGEPAAASRALAPALARPRRHAAAGRSQEVWRGGGRVALLSPRCH